MTVAITWIGDGGASHDVEVNAEDVESRPGNDLDKLVEILDTTRQGQSIFEQFWWCKKHLEN